MLFLVLQANYFEKISLILIFSLVNPNAPGLFRRNSVLKCASRAEIAKNSPKAHLLGLKVMLGHRC